MFAKNYLLTIVPISMIAISCSAVSWASTPVNQRPAPLHAANESMRIAGQRNYSTAAGNIDGKVTDTGGLPLSGITISLQLQGESAN